MPVAIYKKINTRKLEKSYKILDLYVSFSVTNPLNFCPDFEVQKISKV